MGKLPDALEITMPDGTVRHIGIRAVMSTVHESPRDSGGLTPCCDRTPFELPRTDRMTVDPGLVTCGNR